MTIEQGEAGRDTIVAASPTPLPLVPRRRLRRSPMLAVLLAMLLAPVAVVVGVAAAQSGPTATITVHIDIRYSHYVPSRVSVPVSVPVRFIISNLDPIDHEWIVGDAATHAVHRTGTEQHHGARPTEVSIGPMQTVETVVTFAARDQLLFICHLPGHEQYGMVGTLDIR